MYRILDLTKIIFTEKVLFQGVLPAAIYCDDLEWRRC